MRINLYDHQKKAFKQLRTGSILWGGVGSGKTLTALTYYYVKECGGSIEPFTEMKNPKNLYVITTARKRDSLDWMRDAAQFGITTDPYSYGDNVTISIDSWNNIKHYESVEDAFFIFDEQRLVGSGAWVKSFLKISKSNHWILLSATPGDSWSDYIPVFIANGFYKNRTEFLRRHAVYNNFTPFPKIDHYIDVNHLERLKNSILVKMDYQRKVKVFNRDIDVPYDKSLLDKVRERWNPFTNKPIATISEYCYTMRRVVNSDLRRIDVIKELARKHGKIIVFYNFDYELDMLRRIEEDGFVVAEYNGHLHQDIPQSLQWIYLVQYISGSEAWNCIETNTIVFYSLNYSYKTTIQAAGRIDRLNTPFTRLFYYYLKSNSKIDNDIMKALMEKKDFNERSYEQDFSSRQIHTL